MSEISPEQYRRMMESIKKEFPDWDGTISSLPITVVVNSYIDDKNELKLIIDRAVNEVLGKVIKR